MGEHIEVHRANEFAILISPCDANKTIAWQLKHEDDFTDIRAGMAAWWTTQ